MRIAIAADHNGVRIKQDLVDRFEADGHQVDDRGVHDGSPVDYPALCEDLARQVLLGTAERAIMIGGTGSGEQMALNKLRGIRAALASGPLTTEISRAHNDANVLVLGAKVLEAEECADLAKLWLQTPFRGGRHQRRLDQIAALERGESLLDL